MRYFLKFALLTNLVSVVPFASALTMDLGFIKEEPYRKSKQAIDVSSISTPHEAQVIKDAITPIMRLLVGITFAALPPAVEGELLTKHGREVLRMPPLRNDKKRYSISEIGGWRVCGDNRLSFSAAYADLLGKNRWRESFIFEKTDGLWRFEDHGELRNDCK